MNCSVAPENVLPWSLSKCICPWWDFERLIGTVEIDLSSDCFGTSISTSKEIAFFFLDTKLWRKI